MRKDRYKQPCSYLLERSASSPNPSRMDPAQARERRLAIDELAGGNMKFSVTQVEWVTFIVGGVHFTTQKSTLENVPNTFLSNLNPRSPYYDPRVDAYVFDRNPNLFPYVLDFYRTGTIHFPHSFCGPLVQTELAFWGVEENTVAPCCWNRYREYNEQEQTLHSIGKAFNVVDTFEDKKRKNFVLKGIHKIRAGIWYFLEDPTSSIPAQIWAMLYVLLVLASVMTLALDTHEAFRVPSPTNRSSSEVSQNYKQRIRDETNPHPGLYYTELVVSCIFAADLLVRFIVCPSKVRFLKSFINWLDILVVVSQWATVGITFMPQFWIDKKLQKAYQFFSLLRICRVFLILKLARHYTGLRILLLALKASFKEILLLIIFMIIGMVIFSTLIYYAEFSQKGQFKDIPTGFWWAIVTMTTVGYGDVHPKSGPGYVVGALCALSGMLVTGLPIPIIANNFTFFYNVSKLKRSMDERQQITLSSEVFYHVKSIFRMGEGIVNKVTTSAASGIQSISDAATGKMRKKSQVDGMESSDPDAESNDATHGNHVANSTLMVLPAITLSPHVDEIKYSHVRKNLPPLKNKNDQTVTSQKDDSKDGSQMTKPE